MKRDKTNLPLPRFSPRDEFQLWVRWTKLSGLIPLPVVPELGVQAGFVVLGEFQSRQEEGEGHEEAETAQILLK